MRASYHRGVLILFVNSSAATKLQQVPRGNMVCIEDSIIDIKNQTYEMNTTNLTFVHLIKIDEKCFYKVSEANKEW